MNILHVYDQPWPHDPVLIVGSPQALIGLRCAIEDALSGRSVAYMDTQCVDGEGYRVIVKCDLQMEANRIDLPTPYSDPVFATQGPGPWDDEKVKQTLKAPIKHES